METKYYVIMIDYGNLVYIKDEEGKILEFDTELEVKEALSEQKKKSYRGLLGWKKEEINDL